MKPQESASSPEPAEQLPNAVLPPDFESFRNSPSPSSAKEPEVKEPAVKAPAVKAPAVKAPVVEVEESDDLDEVSDPLIRSLLGNGVDVEAEADEAEAATAAAAAEAAAKKLADDKAAESDEEKLPDGELKGSEAEIKVRKAFTSQRKRLTDQIEALEKKVNEGTTGTSPEVAKELTRYETENKALRAQIESQEKFVQIAALESSQAYRDSVKAPIESLKTDIIRIAKDNGGPEAGVSATEIYRAIQGGDRTTLNSILVNLSEADKIELITLEKEFKGIKTTEKALRENAAAASEEFDKSTNAENQKRFGEAKVTYNKALDESKAAIAGVLKGIFEEVEGADDWNAQVKSAHADFDRLGGAHPSQVTPQDLASLVSDHVAAKLLVFKNQALQTEVARLTKRLIQRRANTPAAGGGAGSSTPAAASNGAKPMPTAADFIHR